MVHSSLTPDFIHHFIQETEARWANKRIDKALYGFQFQPGTKWNPGLSDEAIQAYQTALGTQFPTDLVTFLRHANGTDRQTVNLYGDDGTPRAYAPGVYSYPKDLEIVQQRMAWLFDSWEAALEALALETDKLGDNPQFVPIYAHRYVLCNGKPDSSMVCSIYGTDAIVYAPDLKTYLEMEFLDLAD